MQEKPTLRFYQIWNMCFGFLGIQFGFALQNANVSRIFQTLGAKIDDIPILWIAAPLTGLLVQPIVGYFSDNTWTRLGRRRPYFVLGAVFASAALFGMPHSSALWMAAMMLWVMDASFNIAMEPFRAYVGDMLPDKQRTLGFVTQSFFIGIGAVVASIFPWLLHHGLGISNTAEDGALPKTVIYSFYVGAMVLFTSVLWTVVSSREYPPDDFARYASEPEGAADRSLPVTFSKTQSLSWGGSGLVGIVLIWALGWKQELYIVASLPLAYSVISIYVTYLQANNKRLGALFNIVKDFKCMPSLMKQLAWVQFFSWFALFSMWIYSTPAVTSYHFQTSDPGSSAYNEGANWVGVLFAVYNGVAAVVAFLLPWVANYCGRKLTHSLCLLCGALGLGSFVFIRDPDYLCLSMLGVGVAWASILSMPYAMLSSAISEKKMGVYMGIFNFFIVIPQLLAASILGVLVHYLFSGQTIFALLAGGGCMLVAALLSLKLKRL